MADPRLEHQTLKIRDLVEDYRYGRIVIPEFQREYVWKKSRAPRLIDSLYRGFPVSSLLLWRGAEMTRSRNREPRPSQSGPVNWLIDGQQRVITLVRTLNGDEGIEVVFNPDLEEDCFRLSNAATKKDSSWVRVADIWNDELYRNFRRNFDGSRKAEVREAKFDKVRRILDYEIPLVRMADHTFDNAVNAFTRINTLGVRLKKEDIESARVAARHGGFIADEVAPYLKEKHNQGFARLSIMHLFRACAFVAKTDGTNRTPLHKLEEREVLRAWKETKQATEQALGLIRSELGLVNMEILWSGALVVPLIAICATMPPRTRDSQECIGWLALAALLHRYSKSSDTALDQDLRACKTSDPVGALLTNLRQARSSLLASPEDFSGSLADKSGLLALYIACMNRGILDFFTGGKVLLQKHVDRHHILPRAQFKELERFSADNIANIAFIATDVNKSIGLSGPEVYLKRITPQVLKSQCIPDNQGLWSIDAAEDFWRVRRRLLSESFNEFLRKSLPQRRLG